MTDSADLPLPTDGPAGDAAGRLEPNWPTPNWHTTEQLLQTLNQELGGIKEYVLTELRGEITSLRSEKLQLQSQVQELRHQQELLVSDRQQQQQQQWAQQFAQVMAQTLRQQLQAQVFGLAESEGRPQSPEQRLLALQQQMANLEEALAQAMGSVQADLAQHQSRLSQQLLRMQDLEQQGELLLGQLVQNLQRVQPDAAAGLDGPGEDGPEADRGERSPRPPSHPTDVASVMATLDLQQPPAASTSTQGVAAPRAAAMPTPPRLTRPLATHQPRSQGNILDVGIDEGADETFMADFPIDVVKPRATPAPPSSGDRSSGGVSNTVSGSSPDMSSASLLDGFPLLPSPDSPLGEESSQPAPTGASLPRTPWQTEPPQTISSLRELIAPGGAGAVMPGSAPSGAFDANAGVAPGEAPSEAPGQVQDLAPDLTDRPSALLERGRRMDPGAFEAHLPPLSRPAAGQALGHDRRALPGGRLRRSGFVIAALGLGLMALQLLTVQLLFHGAPLLMAWLPGGELDNGANGGALETAGLIAPTWSSALVTFWIRMLMLLPFIMVMGQGLYPPLMEEMQQVVSDRDRVPLISIAASSLFLFLGHFLLYGAIAQASVTPAVALFFSYPLIAQALGWSLLGQSLSQARLGAMAVLGLGLVTLLFQWGPAGGLVAGLASGLCFALYRMLTSVNSRRVNRLPLTVLQFALAWLFSMPALLFLPQVQPRNEIGYVLACLLLSLTVLLNYVFEKASLLRLGSGWSAAVMGCLPLVVGLGGLLLTSERLAVGQLVGVGLVTAGAIALGWLRRVR